MTLRLRAHRRLAHFRPFARAYATPDETEHHRIRTADGVELRLRRLPPRPLPGAPVSRPEPVMLLHGLGSNPLGFLFPGRSFAAHLSARGHDVWLPELRGSGQSGVDGFEWTFGDYLSQDLPAILDHIRRHSGSRRVAWVGHSMGGILLLCWGIRHGGAEVSRGITLGSALDYRPGQTRFSALEPLEPILERMMALPYGTVSHLAGPLWGRFEVLDRLNVWPPNIEPEHTRRLQSMAFHTIPISLLRSLAGALREEGLRDEQGRFLDDAGRYPIETLMVAGSRDAQVSVEAVEDTARRVGARLEVFGRGRGTVEEYGHWDLILGRRAAQETWPVLTAFLEGEEAG
ncbi:MAG: alpha/beta fold hydrolase [Deltaproteobacteria bacterium]|nr:alpha/beta fold hydrolase [Deltaproteobacteria bacterium]